MGPGTIQLIITGAAVIIEAVLIYYIYKIFKLRRVLALTDTSPIDQVNFEGLFEIKGEVACPNPITVMGIPCVYYHYLRERKRRSSGRHGGSSWHKDYEETKFVPFFVKDETGLIQVASEGAETDNLVLHKGRDYDDMGGGGILGGMFSSDTGVTRDKLQGIRVGDQAYVVGSAVEAGKVFVIQKGPYGPLFISNKSEEVAKRNKLILGVVLLLVAAGIPTLLAVFWGKIAGYSR